MQGDTSVSAVLALWASEQPTDVAAEYAAVRCFFARQGSDSCTANHCDRLLPASAVAALLRLHHASRECALVEQLECLQSAFGLVASPLLAAVQVLPKQPLSEVQLPALQLAAAFEGLEEGLGQLSGQLGLLQQLGWSEALQEFLAGASAEDLRRLVDGAEDHGERCLCKKSYYKQPTRHHTVLCPQDSYIKG
jgi:hypothetical protein